MGDESSTRYNGRVWVDKSVSTDGVKFGDTTIENDSDFLVTYSALATSTRVVGQTPSDTVFILDFSASMTWGYEESGQSVSQNESRLQAMVNAMNKAIDELVKANPQNRIAIMTFNGSCGEDQALIPTLMTGSDILGAMNGSDDYLEITAYDQNLNDGLDKAKATVTCNINNETAKTGGGTNVQAGLFRGMSILTADNVDTTADVNGVEVTRTPNVILMSDGAPTTFSSADNASYVSYDDKMTGDGKYTTVKNDGERVKGVITTDSTVIRDTDYTVESGDWWKTNSGEQIGAGNNNNPDSADGFMTLLTASYFKNAISHNYYGNSGDEANVYTIGFGTSVQDDDMVAMANLVLNPADNLNKTTNYNQVDEVSTAWGAYSSTDGDVIVHAPIGDGSNELHIPFKVARCTDNDNNPTSLAYPTQYFSASDGDELDDIFGSIADLITAEASVPTEVTGDPMSDGYLTYTDTTGEYMEIKDVKKLIFMDQALDVTVDEEASEKAGEGVTVYKAKSYPYENPAYPGHEYDTSQISIEVKDNGNANTQTITVKIPAALIPLRTNTITLDGNGNPKNNEVSGNMPLRLCYTVGLDSDIDPVTLEGVSDDYLSAHKDDAGNVSFYSNRYDADDSENNGVGATVTFEPSPTNPFYFIQEDTPLYADANGGKRATGEIDSNATYYVPVTYYTGAGESVKMKADYVERSGKDLEGVVDNNADGTLYIKKGSPRLGNLSDVTAVKGSPEDGGANNTGTYANYREPTFVYDQGHDGNAQQGHFVVLLGNNGLLTLPEPGSLTITKEVETTNGLTAPNAEFTFKISSDEMKGKTVSATKTTPGVNGAEDTTESVSLEFNDSGVATTKLKAGQSIKLPGMQGAKYTVQEVNLSDGFTNTSVSGAETLDQQVASGAVKPGDNDALTFTNTYSASGKLEGSTDLKVTKNLVGRTFKEGDSFTFTLTAGDEKTQEAIVNKTIVLPDNADGITVTGEANDKDTSKTASFGNITFKAADTYTFTVSETIPDDATNPDVKDGAGKLVTYKNANEEQKQKSGWTLNGVTYDNAAKTVKVTTKDDKQDGTLTVTVDKGSDELVFVNSYKPGGETTLAKDAFELTKVLEGKTWDGDSFTFELTAESATDANGNAIDQSNIPLPTDDIDKDGSPTTATVSKANDKDADGNDQATFGFGSITYTQPGIYTYQVKEVVPGNSDPTFNAGMSYDNNTVATITVTVTDDLNGGLVAAVTARQNTTFTNTYKSELNYNAVGGLAIVKTMKGKDIKAGDFAFTVTPQASADGKTTGAEAAEKLGISEAGTQLESTDASMTDGEATETIPVVSQDVTFTQKDVGKVYTYRVTEKNAGKTINGVTYDNTSYTVTIETADNGKGGLTVTTTVTPSDGSAKTYTYTSGNEGEHAVIPFENSYEAQGELGGKGSVSLKAKKEIENASIADYAGAFTFTVKAQGKSDTKTFATAQNAADGSITFPAIKFTTSSLADDASKGYAQQQADGSYRYTFQVSEDTSKMPDGVTAQAASFTVGVTVKDAGDGTLGISVDYPDGSENGLTFVNTYGASAKTQVNVGGTKVYRVQEGATNAPDIAGKYTFTLAGVDENGADAPLPKATETTNDVSGSVTFGTIDYTIDDLAGVAKNADGTRSKVFTYTVKETGSVAGVTNDPNDTRTFTVTLTDDGKGGLTAVSSETPGAQFAFTNSYTYKQESSSPTGKGGITISKKLTGRDLAKDEFTFTMTGVSENAQDMDLTASNDANGNVSFGELTFKKPGTYQFRIAEQQGSLGGVAYDTATYNATATVTDQGDGTLGVTWSFTDAKDAAVDAITFKNTYTANPATIGLGALKRLDGGELTDEAFSFVLSDADGNEIDRAQNDANGEVRFAPVTFTKAGTYTYTIAEVLPEDDDSKTAGVQHDGITYDDTVYTVTVKVEDSGKGALTVADVSFGDDADAAVFTNKVEDTEEPPAENPPSENPPSENPPTEEPPAQNPPTDTTTTTATTTKTEQKPSGSTLMQTGDMAPTLIGGALTVGVIAVVAGIVLKKRGE